MPLFIFSDLLLDHQRALPCGTHPFIQHLHLSLMQMFHHLHNSSLLQQFFQEDKLEIRDCGFAEIPNSNLKLLLQASLIPCHVNYWTANKLMFS
jgi:hypothetical protein